MNTSSISSRNISAEEKKIRQDLAACYRLFHHYQLTDIIYNHISARLPGTQDLFLINPYGLMYDEMTASCFVVVDVNGDIVYDPTGLGINPGGFTLHSAVHMARHDVQCVMHTHTESTVAVSCMARGVLPLSQHAMRFHNRIAYHSYEGVLFTNEERLRVQSALSDKLVMLLRNHGSLVCGRTIPEAFDLMIHLERACQAQVKTLMSGEQLIMPSPEVAEQVAQAYESPKRQGGDKAWPALMRMLDRQDPSYKD